MPSYNERLTANNQKIDEITALANELPDADEINEKIDAQDTIIENLKTALDEKAGKTGGTPNIFLQTTEPTSKQGIWLQVADKEYEKVVAEDSVVTTPAWLPDGTVRVIPYDFYEGSIATVGTDIYLLGGRDNTSFNYKYDTLTNTYTRMSNMPYEIYSVGNATAIETNIYIFYRYMQVYKYDTTTDTYTSLASRPYEFMGGSTVAVGTNIYTLGGGSNNYNKPYYNYKYDIINNTWTKMTDIPFNLFYGSATVIGTDIYIFGGTSDYTDYNKACKYDTTTDTYTQLTNVPYQFNRGSTIAVGNDVYLFGGNQNTTIRVTCYKYNTLTDTYTQMTNIPYAFYNGSATLVNNWIYLLGGESYKTKVQVLAFPSSEFDDKSIVLLNGSTYETQLFTSELVDSSVKYPFSDVWLYEESEGGLKTDIPTYYRKWYTVD